jgi:hypothetical protein
MATADAVSSDFEKRDIGFLVIRSVKFALVSGYHRRVKIHRHETAIYGAADVPETGIFEVAWQSRDCEHAIIAAIVWRRSIQERI